MHYGRRRGRQHLLDEIVLSGFAILERARRKGNRWKRGGGMSGMVVEMVVVVAAYVFHRVWLCNSSHANTSF